MFIVLIHEYFSSYCWCCSYCCCCCVAFISCVRSFFLFSFFMLFHVLHCYATLYTDQQTQIRNKYIKIRLEASSANLCDHGNIHDSSVTMGCDKSEGLKFQLVYCMAENAMEKLPTNCTWEKGSFMDAREEANMFLWSIRKVQYKNGMIPSILLTYSCYFLLLRQLFAPILLRLFLLFTSIV